MVDSKKQEELEDQLGKAAEMAKGVVKPLMNFLTIALPYIITYSKKAHAFYKKLPHDYIELLTGVVFCFMGGFYPALFAAIEAARFGGLEIVRDSFADLADEALKIIEASKKDDKLDKDGDGVSDVDQMDVDDYLVRKGQLVLQKMDPNKVNKAIGALYKVWLSVLAVLAVQFARVATMSATITEFLQRPLDRYVIPVIEPAAPKEYRKWVPVTISWMVKLFAMSLAWYIQTIISAVGSAMRGGLMMSRSLMKLAYKNGWKFVPQDDKDTNIDEYVSYGLAAVGFWFQFQLDFAVPFPFNILLFPFEIAEGWIKYEVANSN